MSDDPAPFDDLQDRIVTVNRILVTQRTLPARLDAVAAIIERMISACDAVSIGLVLKGEAGTAATSGDLAIEADLAQYSTGEGPCLDSVSTGQTVHVEILEHDENYRHFAPLAVELGVEAVLSVPLVHEDRVVGSANLYSAHAHGLTDIDLANLAPVFGYAAEAIATSP